MAGTEHDDIENVQGSVASTEEPITPTDSITSGSTEHVLSTINKNPAATIHPLDSDWAIMKTALLAAKHGVDILNASRQFKQAMDAYFTQLSLSKGGAPEGSADDVCKLLAKLDEKNPIKNQDILNHMDRLTIAIGDCNKSLYGRNRQVWRAVNEDYNPVNALMLRVANQISLSLFPNTEQEKSEKWLEQNARRQKARVNECETNDREQVMQFISDIYTASKREAEQSLLELNVAIKQYLSAPKQKNIDEVVDLFNRCWGNKTSEQLILPMLQRDSSLCSKTFDLYGKLALSVFKEASNGKINLPQIQRPDELKLLYGKQKARALIASKQKAFFQSKENIECLKNAEDKITKATTIEELKAGLDILKTYKPREGIFSLINGLKSHLNRNWKPNTVQNAEKIGQEISEPTSPRGPS